MWCSVVTCVHCGGKEHQCPTSWYRIGLLQTSHSQGTLAAAISLLMQSGLALQHSHLVPHSCSHSTTCEGPLRPPCCPGDSCSYPAAHEEFLQPSCGPGALAAILLPMRGSCSHPATRGALAAILLPGGLLQPFSTLEVLLQPFSTLEGLL